MRANALLLLDDGMSCEEIAKDLYLDDDTNRYWYQLYREKGPEWLADFGYKGRACDHAGLPCKVARAICPDRAGSEMMMAGRLPVPTRLKPFACWRPCDRAWCQARRIPLPRCPWTSLHRHCHFRFSIGIARLAVRRTLRKGQPAQRARCAMSLVVTAASVLAVQSPAAHITRRRELPLTGYIIEWQSTRPTNWPAAS